MTTVDFIDKVLSSLSRKVDTVCLVDADSIIWKAGYACQTTIYDLTLPNGMIATYHSLDDLKRMVEANFPEAGEKLTEKKIIDFFKSSTGSSMYTLNTRVETESLANCLHTVKSMINKIMDTNKTDKDNTILFAAAINNFRPLVDPTYKANRTQPKPLFYDDILNYLKSYYNLHQPVGYEADDAVGIAANYIETIQPQWHVIMSHIDKDLDQLAGVHHNYSTDKIYFVDSFAANYLLMKQMLTGDFSDNIRGVPKIGEKRAEKLLKAVPIQHSANEQYLAELFRVVGLAYAVVFDDPEAEMLNTYSMLKILTEEPKNEEDQK